MAEVCRLECWLHLGFSRVGIKASNSPECHLQVVTWKTHKQKSKKKLKLFIVPLESQISTGPRWTSRLWDEHLKRSNSFLLWTGGEILFLFLHSCGITQTRPSSGQCKIILVVCFTIILSASKVTHVSKTTGRKQVCDHNPHTCIFQGEAFLTRYYILEDKQNISFQSWYINKVVTIICFLIFWVSLKKQHSRAVVSNSEKHSWPKCKSHSNINLYWKIFLQIICFDLLICFFFICSPLI